MVDIPTAHHYHITMPDESADKMATILGVVRESGEATPTPVDTITPVVIPAVPERRNRGNLTALPSRPNPLREALAAKGVSRMGLIERLVKIAETGEKVVIKEKRGVVVERVVTRDPSVQMKAISHLNELLDRADGVVSRERATYERTTYRDDD